MCVQTDTSKTQLHCFSVELPQLHLENHNPSVCTPNHNTIMSHCITDICLGTYTSILPNSGCITANIASASYNFSSLCGLELHHHAVGPGHTHH
jgi:hypothetical protein